MINIIDKNIFIALSETVNELYYNSMVAYPYMVKPVNDQIRTSTQVGATRIYRSIRQSMELIFDQTNYPD